MEESDFDVTHVTILVYNHTGQYWEVFEVPINIALQSETIKNLVEDIGYTTPIPLSDRTGKLIVDADDFADILDYLCAHTPNIDDEYRSCQTNYTEKLGTPKNSCLPLIEQKFKRGETSKIDKYIRPCITVDEARLKKFDEFYFSKDKTAGKSINTNRIYRLLNLASYLNITNLLNFLSAKMADLLIGKDPVEMCEILGIKCEKMSNEEKQEYDKNFGFLKDI